jgi:3',5'-cyclic AMP phosphodiesterase CpdA
MFRIAHLSDIHLGPLPAARLREVSGKRIIGYLNWQWKRRYANSHQVLDEVVASLSKREVEHIAITGDLTNISLAAEYDNARCWLDMLGGPATVSVVPGNHDLYTWAKIPDGMELLYPYMDKDGSFPYVKNFGDIAVIGLSSAQLMPPFIAAGRVDSEQLVRLRELLSIAGDSCQFRILLLHHPLLPIRNNWQRGLRNWRELYNVLREQGVELILHGHTHKYSTQRVGMEQGAVPVIGASSASASSNVAERLAGYNIITVTRVNDRWSQEVERVTVTVR